MLLAFALQSLGLGLVLAGATLTGVGCCIAAALVVAGELLHASNRPRE